MFRVYAAKKILFAKRRRVICTTLCFESVLQARHLLRNGLGANKPKNTESI